MTSAPPETEAPPAPAGRGGSPPVALGLHAGTALAGDAAGPPAAFPAAVTLPAPPQGAVTLPVPGGGSDGDGRGEGLGSPLDPPPAPEALTVTLTPSSTLVFSDGGDLDWEERLFDMGAGRTGDETDAPAAHGSAVSRAVPLAPSARFWRGVAESFIAKLCRLPDDDMLLNMTPPSEEELEQQAGSAPPMPGGEYLSSESLLRIWISLAVWVAKSLDGLPVAEFLARRAPRWRRVGRVTFHLAENRGGAAAEKPFAFLATYVTSLTAEGRDQHLPLKRALVQYSGASDKPALINLLSPVRAAADRLPWVREMDATGRLYQAQAWTVSEAHTFLRDIPVLEESGLTVRIPDWWRKKPEVRVKIVIGNEKAPVFGLNSLIDWDVQLAVGDESLTPEEVEQLLSAVGTGDLVFFKGKWVEANREQLAQALDYWSEARAAGGSGVTFLEAMRLLSGMPSPPGEAGPAGLPDPGDWVKPEAGAALKDILARLRSPEAAAVPPELTAELRPYQQVGLGWLSLVTGLGLGACLADDMGLGKTIQVLALLLLDRRARAEAGGLPALPFRTGGSGKPPKAPKGRGAAPPLFGGAADTEGPGREGAPGRRRPAPSVRPLRDPAAAPASAAPAYDPPSLLVAPASLLANWRSEAGRFAPSLRLNIYHPSENGREILAGWEADPPSICRDCDLVVTSYALLARRLELFESLDFRMVILDEAQAIKNPATAQSRAVRRIRSQARLALTGTPIENRLADLWSLFDFLDPGLLGSHARFSEVVTELERRKEDQYGPLRRLVAPYLLRRLKSDTRIIADLPDKVETSLYCHLTPVQAKLYAQVVESLQKELKAFPGSGTERMKRRGLVLQSLLRLKQLVNHPAHMTGDGDWDPSRSGKFMRVAELARDMAERQDRLLVFTQYQEIISPLMEHLARIFGRAGLCLHGGTPVRQRRQLVDEFQRPDGPPFFILSLKAGGTGLNLTAAGQVIHFDRWW
ncbi:MAG: DEAD/DEAH box helicase, partial [Deltaproteobacteria bacterium]|nr:DEAD/DEAH box helicase [Deltaproteobacteria bacterium]